MNNTYEVFTFSEKLTVKKCTSYQHALDKIRAGTNIDCSCLWRISCIETGQQWHKSGASWVSVAEIPEEINNHAIHTTHTRRTERFNP